MTISRGPTVLVIHLKRFSFGGNGGKISKTIEFPLSLELPLSNDGGGGIALYELTGVVVHHGHSVHSGHYIAFVKAPNKQWLEMNDSTVSVVSVNRVLAAQAYLLFYSRTDLKIAPATQVISKDTNPLQLLSQLSQTQPSLPSQTTVKDSTSESSLPTEPSKDPPPQPSGNATNGHASISQESPTIQLYYEFGTRLRVLTSWMLRPMRFVLIMILHLAIDFLILIAMKVSRECFLEVVFQ